MIDSNLAYEAGFAILAGTDMLTGEFHFRFRGESFTLKRMALSNEQPNKLVILHDIDIGSKYFTKGARIEDIRKAMEYE